jgi:hypothetical protein
VREKKRERKKEREKGRERERERERERKREREREKERERRRGRESLLAPFIVGEFFLLSSFLPSRLAAPSACISCQKRPNTAVKETWQANSTISLH